MRSIFILLFFISMPLVSWAQNSGNVQKSYLNGKELFNSGQYNLAIEAFKPLTTYSNSFSEYATFFYALSAYYDGQEDIAKNILLQLIRKYPNWNKKSEALYWLGKVYFEKEDYTQAMVHLQEINDRSLAEDVSDLKKHHLIQAPQMVLKELYTEYPRDNDLGESLARKMALQPLSEEDTEILKKLIDKHDLAMEDISNQLVGPTVMKEMYKVGVCFPFLVKDLKDDRRFNSNQWVLDLYQGIQFGQKKLRSQNIPIELFAYDTERDSSKTASIFSSDEMKSMDLIIGPLYPGPSKIASDFAYANKINILNPLSSNTQIIANNPYSFLFRPGDETQAKVAANFMVDKIEKDKKALIVYGSRVSDSIAAFQYQSILNEKNIEVILMDKIPTVDAEEVARFISENLHEIFGVNTEEKPIRDDIGHIYVASSNELIVANVIGTIDNLGPQLNMMGNEDWLESRYIDFQQLERLQVYLTAPYYLDYASDNLKSFQKDFMAQTKTLPNKYNFIGYDLMLFFGKLLKSGGTYFQHHLRRNEFYGGNLFQGFSYTEANDNSYIPIVRFEEGTLTQVNRN